MIICKFGGSSLASTDNLKKILNILQKISNSGEQLIVVVSAVGGITNKLITCANYAGEGKYNACRQLTNEIKEQYIKLLQGSIESSYKIDQGKLLEYLQQLDSIIYGLSLTRDKTPRILDTILGYGELMSTWLLRELCLSAFSDAVCLDTRKVIITDDIFTNANINWEKSKAKLKEYFNGKENISLIVATGFIASTKDEIPTTIGRNGSDYTASIIGSILGASGIYIYTDVDGVLTADPNYVDNAYPLTNLSYEEAIDLAYFGAEVLHPKTMIPAMQNNIPVFIKNTSKPNAQGTKIAFSQGDNNIVKTVTSIDNLSLINLEWNLIIPGSDYSEKLFTIFRKLQLDPWLMNIAPFSQNISFAIPMERENDVVELINNKFELEIQKKWLKPIGLITGVSLISIVGDNIAKNSQTSKKLFDAINKVNADILAISQGLSSRMISFIVSGKSVENVVCSIHNAFHLSRQEINIIQYGKGLVGSTLLDIITDYNQKNSNNSTMPLIRHIAISGKSQTLFNSSGIDIKTIETAFKEDNLRVLPKNLIDNIKNKGLFNVIAVDVTDSDSLVNEYKEFINAGIHLVSSNKKPFTIEQNEIEGLKAKAREKDVKICYETTVGAGLPVIDVVQSLLKTGDSIESIEGIFSGSLNYICSAIQAGEKFSNAVMGAKEKGYTEPHPGEDLSGRDMARKALILSRELGISCNFKDLDLTGLVSDEICNQKDMTVFWNKLKELDNHYSEQITNLKKAGKTLRFVATISKNNIFVGLKKVDINGSLGGLKGAENIVVITSKFYNTNPLVIKGPGAGAYVTAAGAFADILGIAAHLP